MLLNKILRRYYQGLRISIFKRLGTATKINGIVTQNQPLIMNGAGEIYFGNNVIIGYNPSPKFYDTIAYLEVRNVGARINIGDNVIINNAASIICDRTEINIGRNVLIGIGVSIIDSDFHEIHPNSRQGGNHVCAPVNIEDNVFIGNDVTILKGVHIGKNSVVASASVVTKSFPENVIIAGNPAKIIKTIAYE
ncbi:Maltose O-acetyltransferase [compost metagenome]